MLKLINVEGPLQPHFGPETIAYKTALHGIVIIQYTGHLGSSVVSVADDKITGLNPLIRAVIGSNLGCEMALFFQL